VLYISQYSEFVFEKKLLSVTAGTQAFVDMQVPVSGVAAKVSCASRSAQGGNASAIVSAGAANSVCILDPHAPRPGGAALPFGPRGAVVRPSFSGPLEGTVFHGPPEHEPEGKLPGPSPAPNHFSKR
jgi:hypothetical protein